MDPVSTVKIGGSISEWATADPAPAEYLQIWQAESSTYPEGATCYETLEARQGPFFEKSNTTGGRDQSEPTADAMRGLSLPCASHAIAGFPPSQFCALFPWQPQGAILVLHFVPFFRKGQQ